MAENRRKHVRFPMSVSVKISHPSIGEKIVKTKNISDGGLFLLVDSTEMPPVGEIISGQIQGMDDAPIINMKIVRVETQGLGLQFIDS